MQMWASQALKIHVLDCFAASEQQVTALTVWGAQRGSIPNESPHLLYMYTEQESAVPVRSQ